MNKKTNLDHLTDDQIMSLMYTEAILDAIDEMVDEMETYPDVSSIISKIKVKQSK